MDEDISTAMNEQDEDEHDERFANGIGEHTSRIETGERMDGEMDTRGGNCLTGAVIVCRCWDEHHVNHVVPIQNGVDDPVQAGGFAGGKALDVLGAFGSPVFGIDGISLLIQVDDVHGDDERWRCLVAMVAD